MSTAIGIGIGIGIPFSRRRGETIVDYTATGAITEIEPETVTFDTDHFVVPLGVHAFSFKDDGKIIYAYFDAGWQFLPAEYYFTKQDGNDDNTGRSDAQAWATVAKNQAQSYGSGDIAQYKAGGLWVITTSSTRPNILWSGLLGRPFTLRGYGEGNKPIFDNRGKLLRTIGGTLYEWDDEAVWERVGVTDVWKTLVPIVPVQYYEHHTAARGRLWMNTGAGLDEEFQATSEETVSAETPWRHTEAVSPETGSYLCVYSPGGTNPANHYTEIVCTYGDEAMSTGEEAHLHIRGLDIRGSRNAIRLGSSNVIIEHCNIGGYCIQHGISVSRAVVNENVIIRYNNFDTLSKEGQTQEMLIRQGFDAIAMSGNNRNFQIYGNVIKDWYHTGFDIHSTEGTMRVMENLKVWDNYFHSPNSHYCRAFSLSYDFIEGQQQGNEFFNNFIDGCPTPSQLSASYGNIYLNILHGSYSWGLMIEAYVGASKYNKIMHNIFANCKVAGIRHLVIAGHTGKVIEGNEICNNIFYNNGYEPAGISGAPPDDGNKYQLVIARSGVMSDYGENIYRNNIFWHDGADIDSKVIWYGKMEEGYEPMTVAEFNAMNGGGANMKEGAIPDIIEGNILGNPEFIDFAGKDYRLESHSACINAGINMDIENSMESTYLNSLHGEDYDGLAFNEPLTPTVGPLEYKAIPYILTLTSDGDGSGVSVMRLTVSDTVLITLDGTARFYTDSGGTQDESTTWEVTTGAERTMYVKCPSGTANMQIDNFHFITEWGDIDNNGWVGTGANHPILGGSLNRLLKYIEKIRIVAKNTLTCNMNYAGANLIDIRMGGTALVTGGFSQCTSLENIYLSECDSDSFVTANIDNIPNLETLQILMGGGVSGRSMIEGDLSNIPFTYVRVHNGDKLTYTQHSWQIDIVYFRISSSTGNGWSVETISDAIKDAADTTWTSTKVFNLGHSNHASMADTNQGGIWGDFSEGDNPSELAEALKELAVTKAVTVTLRDITLPVAEGDGTGFPAGFGAWWRGGELVPYVEQTLVENIEPDTVTYDDSNFTVPGGITEFSFTDDGDTWVFRYEDGTWNLYEFVEYP